MLNNWQAIYQGTNNDYKKRRWRYRRRSSGINDFASQAEITVLKQDPQAGNLLSRLNFTVGGSIPSAVPEYGR